MNKNNLMIGVKFISGKVVMVTRATSELDHGSPFWLCEALPPHKQLFQSVKTEREASEWMRNHCGAEQIFLGGLYE